MVSGKYLVIYFIEKCLTRSQTLRLQLAKGSRSRKSYILSQRPIVDLLLYARSSARLPKWCGGKMAKAYPWGVYNPTGKIRYLHLQCWEEKSQCQIGYCQGMGVGRPLCYFTMWPWTSHFIFLDFIHSLTYSFNKYFLNTYYVSPRPYAWHSDLKIWISD